MTIQRPTAKELFFSVLEISYDKRQSFLLEACKGDDELYRDVVSLVAAYQQAEAFLEEPVADLAAQLILQGKAEPCLTSKSRFLEDIIEQVLDNKYLIKQQLGEGGMGTVYKALHLGTERPVAIKIITPQFMSNSEFLERFKREAKAMGKLSHPNVINITDFGITEIDSVKVAYLVMEYLKGFTLGSLLKKENQLSIGFAIDILEQISSAIDEAHSQGIVHRDLKPENIWLEPDGRGSYHVKVLDFGLAKLYSDNLSEPLSTTNSLVTYNVDKAEVTFLQNLAEQNISNIKTILVDEYVEKGKQTKALRQTKITKGNVVVDTKEHITRVGTIMGTPLYMSPEQCQGVTVNKYTDIYSLGVIAYEMLVGQPPFRGNFKELINKHINTFPQPLNKVNPNVTKTVSDVVLEALNKEPSSRFSSAKAFVTSLRTNFEADNLLISQALNFYWRHFRQITTISFVINSIFVFFSSCLVTIIIKNNFLQNIWWVLLIVLLFVLGEISQGAFAIAVRSSQETNRAPVTKVLAALIKSVPTILVTAFESYLLSLSKIWKLVLPTFQTHIFHSFNSQIITLENKKGFEAMERSKDLLARFYSLAISLKLRSLLVKNVAFILFLVSFFISIRFSSLQGSFVSNLGLTLVCVFLLPGLFLIFASPITDIAITLLYLKSREAKNETLYQQNLLLENETITEKAKFSTLRKALTATALIVSIILAHFSYLLIVPPFEEIPKIASPEFEKVPDQENAWVEYDLAIQNITPISMRIGNSSKLSKQNYYSLINNTGQLTKSAFFKDLEAVAKGQAKLTNEQIRVLDSYSNAYVHLLEGIKRPKAQYFTEAPDYSFTSPNLEQIWAFTVITSAQAQRLLAEGKTKEAVELALAIYHMNTDLARDKNAVVDQVLIAAINRMRVSRTLLFIINSGNTDKITDLEIAQKVSQLDNLMPNAWDPYTQEVRAMCSSLEHIFERNEHSVIFSTEYAFPYVSLGGEFMVKNFAGFRMRFYSDYVNLYQEFSKEASSSVKNWDFSRVYQQVKPITEDISLLLSPINLAAQTSFSHGKINVLGSMRSLYFSHSMGTALTIFAACSAYKKEHGQFPRNLETVLSEAKLPILIDLATKTPVSYRLENNNPVVWFAGIDGQNDGGKDAYDQDTQWWPKQGKDIIFTYGIIPQ